MPIVRPRRVYVLAGLFVLMLSTATSRQAIGDDNAPQEARTGYATAQLSEVYDRLIRALIDADGAPTPDLVEVAGSITESEESELLALAAARNWIDTVRAVLDAGAAVDGRGAAGWTPLMIALFNGHEELALLLIERGADPEARAVDGVSVPQLAEAMRSRRVLWRLAAATGTASAGRILGIAVRSGERNGVEWALASGISPDTPDQEGWTPLFHAITTGQLDILEILLKAGADPDRPGDGLPPLGAAILAGDLPALDKLLAAGANPDGTVEGVPLLHLAILNQQRDLAMRLLGAGAGPARADQDGVAPAELAHALGMDDLVERLGGVSEERQTARPEALLATIMSGDIEGTHRILETGVPADTPLPDGMRPLHVAVLKGEVEIAQQLLERGVAVEAKTPDGDTALIMAVRAPLKPAAQRDLVRLLVKHAAHAGPAVFRATDGDGRTALMHAILLDRQEIVSILTQGVTRAAVDVPDKDGIRPLIAAILTNNSQAVSHLLDAHAAITHPADKATPHDIARQREYWDILAQLPDDRTFPVVLKKGINQAGRRAVQETLRDWGYYNGSIDGIFGPGTAAALKAFLEDRETEVIAMAEAQGDGRWSVEQYENGTFHGDSDAVIHGDPSWFRYEWNNGNSFFGYARTDGRIHSGFGVHRWSTGEESLMLLGLNGFDDETTIP